MKNVKSNIAAFCNRYVGNQNVGDFLFIKITVFFALFVL